MELKVLFGDFRSPAVCKVEADTAPHAIQEFRNKLGYNYLKVQGVLNEETDQVYISGFGWTNNNGRFSG
jgi:hypothetical protein